MMTKIALAVALCGLLAGHVAASPCFDVNWFPVKGDLGVSVNCTSNTAAGGCNSPSVWTQASQDGTGLGGRAAGELFRVALPADNNVDLHRVFSTATTAYVESGVDASACVNSLLKAAAPSSSITRRALRQAATNPTWTTTRALVTGVKVDWELQKEDGTPVTSVTDAYKSGTINNILNPPAAKLEVPGNLADGAYCWEVNVTASVRGDAATTNVTVGNTTTPTSITQWAADNTMTFSQPAVETYKVCFVKRTPQATAELTYDMCKTGKLQLNLTKIAPLAVPLTKNGAAVPGKWLMQPLLKVYGKKVKELDGSESNQEFDENAQNQNFIAKYFLIPTNTTSGDVLTFTIPEALEEGYYKLSADISAYTEFPTLVALSGLTMINQSDYKSTPVFGKYEALTKQLINETETGIQTSPTTLGAISASPAKSTIKAGDQLTFSWTFRGVGSAVCYHDGAVVADCASPVKVAAKALTATDAKKTFTVVFTDVCGRQKNASYSYTQSGVTADSKVELPITTAGGAGTPTTGTGSGTRNAAEGVATSLRTLVLSLLAAVAFAALL